MTRSWEPQPAIQARAITCKKRAAGIRARAQQLATLFGARVALIVRDTPGAAPPVTWVSVEGGVPGLIQDEQRRAQVYRRRVDGITRMASQLVALCGVRVALVIRATQGDVPLVWESEGGVLEKYSAALQPEILAQMGM